MTFRWSGAPNTGKAQVWAGVSDLANNALNLGLTIHTHNEEVKVQNYKLRANAKMMALGDKLEKNTDESQYLKITNRAISEMKKDMDGGLAGQHQSAWLNNEIPTMLHNANESRKIRIEKNSDETLDTLIGQYVGTGNPVALTNHLDSRVRAGYMTPDQAGKVAKTAANRLIYKDAMKMSLEDGLEYINIYVDDPSERRGLRELLTSDKASQKVALAEVHAKQEQSIVDKFVARDFVKIEEFINSQEALTPDEKFTWMGRASNWAEQVMGGVKITTDPRAEAALEKRALDISTGAAARSDVMNEIMDARYGEAPTIDDDTFDSLSTRANTEHKTYQANAMKEAIDYGQTQLLSKGQIEIIASLQITDDEDYNAVLTRLGEQRRLEEETLSQYMRAMSQWFQAEVKAGRDPNDTDIYNESKKKMVHYRSKLQQF